MAHFLHSGQSARRGNPVTRSSGYEEPGAPEGRPIIHFSHPGLIEVSKLMVGVFPDDVVTGTDSTDKVASVVITPASFVRIFDEISK